MFRKLLALTLAAAPAAAQAEWSTATSRHFVVYTETGQQSAKATAETLEKYFFVLKTLSGVKQDKVGPKIKLYMVADPGAVRNTLPYQGAEGIAGYANTTIRGPFAVMPRVVISEGTGGLPAQVVMFHELAHIFMRQYFPAAYPTWYSEGFADFYGSTQIKARDVVEIGAPVENRYFSFQGNQWFPLRKVLTAQTYTDVGPNLGALYSEGWLLVHYLSTTKARPGQLAKYLQGINAGQSFDVAANDAFGDLDNLNNELFDYAHRGRLQLIMLPFKKIDTGEIALRTLSAGQSAMVPLEISLSSGVARGDVGAFADRAAAIGAQYPDDPTVLADVFDAQRLADRTGDAQKTAERWAKLAPDDGMAIAAQAEARADALIAAKSHDVAAWTAVRRDLVTANKLTPNEPRILKAYYDTYAGQGVGAPDTAQPVLYEAFKLLPQDNGLRQQVAADFEARGMIGDAITIIKPLAFDLGDAGGLSAKEKAKRDAVKAKTQLAGDDDDNDQSSPRQMLKRLEAKQAGKKPDA